MKEHKRLWMMVHPLNGEALPSIGLKVFSVKIQGMGDNLSF